MPAVETKQFLWGRFKTFSISFLALHVPWASSVQATKLRRWQTDFCLIRWWAGTEGGRERRLQKFSCGVDNSGKCGVPWGISITYHKDQNPYVRLIPEKNLQIWTPLLVPLMKTARKIFTAHYTHILPSLTLNPNWDPLWNEEIQV